MLQQQLESSTDHGSARHASFKPVSASSRHFRPLESSHGGFQGDAHRAKDGDEVFGDEKRKVHTGPNPLHNR
ncbi:hypothetical protein QUC31_019236 [Theobroma cacao]